MFIDNAKNFTSTTVDISPDKVKNLPNFKARGVIISNRYAGSLADAAAESSQTIFWGYNGVCAHGLYPGQTSEIIPVSSLKDISIAAMPGQSSVVWYSYFE